MLGLDAKFFISWYDRKSVFSCCYDFTSDFYVFFFSVFCYDFQSDFLFPVAIGSYIALFRCGVAVLAHALFPPAIRSSVVKQSTLICRCYTADQLVLHRCFLVQSRRIRYDEVAPMHITRLGQSHEVDLMQI